MPLDGLIDSDHPARLVWDFCLGLDLSPFYDAVRSHEGGPGHPATDPRFLVALWLYATLEGVGSARALAHLCVHHAAFRWLAGGVPVNYHTLAEFRVGHVEWLGGRPARPRRGRLLPPQGHSRRTPGRGAGVQVARLWEEIDDDLTAPSRCHAATRERAARERQVRLDRALARLTGMEAKKKPDEKDKTRASFTDPEASVMKMADGGF